MIGGTRGGYYHDELVGAAARRWLRMKASDLAAEDTPWFLAVNLVNPHDVMFFDTDRPGEVVQMGVYDLAGRRVLNRQVTCDGRGQAVFYFEGLDQKGRLLAAGVYRVVAREGTRRASRSVTLLK